MNLKHGGENELYSLNMNTPEYISMDVYQTTDCGYLTFRRNSEDNENFFHHNSLYQISLSDLQGLKRLFEGLEKYQLAPKLKPVIYLYPPRPTQMDVTLTPHGDTFTETIPHYNTGWRVLARPNGQVTNLADGKTYPYLFWESIGPPVVDDITEGFLVARDDLDAFLREKLAFMGLLPVEYEEFIEFWLPLLSRNAYSLIYFAGEEYTARFPLEITPAPDSVLRVFMVARPATGREKIAPQRLQPFTRKGFSVVEWGGSLFA